MRTLRVLEQVALIEPTVAADKVAEAVLGDLVRDHARFVFKIAYSVLRNHHDAEDATQEIFLRVMRHQRELSGLRDVRAWLARIAWRVSVDHRCAPAHLDDSDATAALEQLRSHSAGAEQAAIGAQMLALTERLIANLPVELRDALTLSTVEEMTSAEIAAVLSIPEASVRTRIFRARKLLKEKLASLLEGKTL
jgi:RNA polymerase sigma-70 factor (ECF subfamily)